LFYANNLLFLVDHIMVFGFNQSFTTFVSYLKLQFKGHKICIVTNTSSNDNILKHLLKKHDCLYCLKGDYLMMSNLITANISCAKYIIINSGDYELKESLSDIAKNNEVYKASILFKLIDSNFDVPILLNIAHEKYSRFLGIEPIQDDNYQQWDEFQIPLFMAGKVLYANYLDKLTALSYTDKLEMEAISSLIKLGNEYIITESLEDDGILNKKLFSGKKIEDNSFYLTLNIPECYYNQEYFILLNDLLELKHPIIPLGIYVEQPLHYSKDFSSTTFAEELDEKTTLEMNSTKTSKAKLNKQILKYIELIKSNNNSSKAVLDSIQMDFNNLPVFITNPNPCFVLGENMKLLVIAPLDYLPDNIRDVKSNSDLDDENERASKESKENRNKKEGKDKKDCNDSKYFSRSLKEKNSKKSSLKTIDSKSEIEKENFIDETLESRIYFKNYILNNS